MNTSSQRIIRIAYITSPEELAFDEQVGRDVVDAMTGEHHGYRMGTLESLARDIREGKSRFAQRFDLAAIVMDGDKDVFDAAWEQEIWPREFTVPQRDDKGKVLGYSTLEEISAHFPHNGWRRLRRDIVGGESIDDFKLRKASAKADYETGMADFLESRGVDLILSDSYTNKFGPVMLARYGGRMLNVHPAIIDLNDSAHLRGAHTSRDGFTRAVYGWIRVDDNRSAGYPQDEWTLVIYNGEKISVVDVEAVAATGVTLHVINENIDDGRIIKSVRYEFSREGITPGKIRMMSYALKTDVVCEGFLSYVAEPETQRLIREGRELQQIYRVQPSGLLIPDFGVVGAITGG